MFIRNANIFPKGNTLDELKAIGIGAEGIVETEGEQWLRQRRLCMKVFKPQFIEEMHPVAIDKTQKALKLLEDHKQIEVLDFLNRIALAIICDVAFGYESECLDGLDSSDRILEAQHFCSEQFMKRLQRTRFWKLMPVPANFKMKRVVEEHKNFYLSLIEKKRDKSSPEAAHNDLLTLLLDAEDEDGTKLSETELVDQMQSFLGAAHESVGTTLHWMLYYLALNPDIEKKVLEEIEAVYGENEILPYEKLKELSYLDQVLNETMRVRPPFPGLAREAVNEHAFEGYKIEKGAFMVALASHLHTREDIWGPNAHEFNPDHFSAENKKKRKRSHFIPFGLGARRCIGEHMSVMEMRTIASMLLRKYKFELVEDQEIVPFVRFSWMTKYGIKMRIVER